MLPADTTDVDGARHSGEEGFGLIELLIAMVVLQVALLALVGAFGAGATALGRADKVNTAATLADQQMELYRSMPYTAIGLDTAGAPTTGNYVTDTTVCPSGKSPVCGNVGPVDNTDTLVWSCTTSSGSTSVSYYFTANGINPCTAERTVSSSSTPVSPDGKTYYVETYVSFCTASTTTSGVTTAGTCSGAGSAVLGARAQKIVSVVVRDAKTNNELAKEVTTFDCSTGNPQNSAPC